MLPQKRTVNWIRHINIKPDSFINLIKPRPTWRYILCTVLFLYVLYCFIRGSPLLASKLPKYAGEYDVGTIDLEIPLDSPVNVANTTTFKHSKDLPFQLETVLFSVYYPAVKGSKSRRRHPWIPRPISLTAEGYARIAKINSFITRPIFTFALWAIAGSIDIPAPIDVMLLGSNEKSDEKFPVMVFSHGFASSRTDYTHYCGELASRGHVVAIIEHRDGSGPGSYVMKNGLKVKKVLPFTDKDVRSDKEIDVPEFKRNQLAFRQAEIEETISILQRINAGEGKKVQESSSLDEGHCLRDWKDRLDFKQLTIAGHSYGATGALQALKPSPSNIAIGGVILDPGKSSGPLNHDINVPILVVHSDTWSKTRSMFYDRPHFDTVRDLVAGVVKKIGASWFVTSVGTSHPSVTDAPLIEPWLLSFTTGATIDVNEGLKEYVKVSMDFFAWLQKGTRQGILAEKPTHLEYGKWVSEEREKEFPKDVARYWEIHVTPDTE